MKIPYLRGKCEELLRENFLQSNLLLCIFMPWINRTNNWGGLAHGRRSTYGCKSYVFCVLFFFYCFVILVLIFSTIILVSYVYEIFYFFCTRVLYEFEACSVISQPVPSSSTTFLNKKDIIKVMTKEALLELFFKFFFLFS